jgi:non-heme chloroperoxidase
MNSKRSTTPTPRDCSRSCSYTASGSSHPVGTTGARSSKEQGYTTLAPGWPDDPDTVEEAKQDPEVFAHKRIKQVTDHYIDAISQLKRKPAVIGHSFGGLIAQRLAGEGVAAVTVAIDPAPFRGVLPLPFSALKSSSTVLGNPSTTPAPSR